MAFIITEPESESESEVDQDESKSSGRFTITPPKEEYKSDPYNVLRTSTAIPVRVAESEVDQDESKSSGRFTITPPKEEYKSDPYNVLRTSTAIPVRVAEGLINAPLSLMNLGQSIAKMVLPEQSYSSPELKEAVEGPKKNPLSELLNYTGAEGFLSPQTSDQESIQNVSKTVGDFLGFGAMLGAGSPAKEIVSGGLFGTGEEAVKRSGGGHIAQFAGGLAAAVGPSVAVSLFKLGKMSLNKGIEYGKYLRTGSKASEVTPRFLEETGPRALADIELNSKDLTGRIAKTSDEILSNFQKNIEKISEPIEKTVQHFDAKQIERSILKSNVNSVLDTVFPTNATQKELWSSLQKTVEINYKNAKAAYKDFYNTAREAVKGEKYKLQETFNALKSLTIDLKQSLISTAEEQGLKSVTENMINKMIPNPSKQTKLLMEDLKAAGIEADYDAVFKMIREDLISKGPREVLLEKAMATTRSISRILKKANIIPAPVDLLKSIQSALKKDIIAGLEEINPEAAKLWQAGEDLFGKTQQTFVNKESLKFRVSLIPEESASQFLKPSNAQRMNEMLGNQIDAKLAFDRLIIEEISKKPTKEAERLAIEFNEYLSKPGQDSLKKLIESGDSLVTTGNQSIARGTILNDIATTASTGKSPKATLDLMRNPVGRNLVKDTLERSPKGKEIYKSLQRVNAEEFISSTLDKNGHIDFVKASEMLKNKTLKQSLVDYLGQEGVEFIEKMDKFGKNFTENMQAFSAKDPTLFQKTMELFAKDFTKGALTSMMFSPLYKVSGALLLGGKISSAARNRYLTKVIENPKTRDTLMKMSSPSVPPSRMSEYIKKLDSLTH